MKFLFLVFLLLATVLNAADWPQYRGPNHDGSTPEKISTKWPQDGPKQIWKAPLGESFGSFAVSAEKAFCFIQRKINDEDKEVALALDASSGKELWAVPLGKPTYDNQGGDGPRSTPTVDGKSVYFLGAYLVLSCLDAATGKMIWQHDLVKENGGSVIQWNNAASPILDGDLIFVNAGGPNQAFLAFHKKDGRLVWKSENDKPTHASPVPATIHGICQIIFFTQKGLASLAPATGKVLWRFPFPYNTSTASSPIVWSNIVYCSAGYGVGGGTCKISKNGNNFSAAELWRTPGHTVNHWTTPVCKDGFLYGLFGFKEFGRAPLQCIEISTGKQIWSQPGFGTGGGTILVGDENILVQGDKGPIVLVEANSTAYKELARGQPLGGKCWTMAVVSNGKIFARNTKEGVCLDVSIK
ncbi:MAG: PQQ-like beta-propeller repeat protein [Verrucomicrobiota bacterium]|nr:PQQ-like beta-propeller repeat protein [Verrucomicrobiota bacterium]